MWRALVCVLLFAGCAEHDIGPDVGASCRAKSECTTRCLTGGDYPGGFCTLDCDSDADCTRGAVCMAREGGVCLFPCAAFAECQRFGTGWDCAVLDTKGNPQQRQQGICIGDGH
jgi:hypothetical protein